MLKILEMDKFSHSSNSSNHNGLQVSDMNFMYPFCNFYFFFKKSCKCIRYSFIVFSNIDIIDLPSLLSIFTPFIFDHYRPFSKSTAYSHKVKMFCSLINHIWDILTMFTLWFLKILCPFYTIKDVNKQYTILLNMNRFNNTTSYFNSPSFCSKIALALDL